MEIQDPHIQSILHMIENRHAIATPDHEIINEIQLAFEFHLINLAGHGFFNTIRQKMGWGLDARSKRI